MGYFKMAGIYPTTPSRYLEIHNIHFYSCAKIIQLHETIFSILLIKTKYMSNSYIDIGDEICMKKIMEGYDLHCIRQINAF
jgi:hypothetical protein